MVDKDGNKVDIMKDLIKLEGQMNSYLDEITLLLDDVKQIEIEKEKCFEGFNAAIPKVIIDQRKRRQQENDAAKQSALTSKLKRPPMKIREKRQSLTAGLEESNASGDPY